MDFFGSIPLFSFLIFIAILGSRIFYLRKKGVEVSGQTDKKNKLSVYIFPVFGLILLIWLFEIIRPAFTVSFSILPDFISKPIVESVFLEITGIIVIMIALVFLLFTLLHFKNSLRLGLNEKNLGNLVTTGIFSVSRNPFFVSIVLYFTGISLILPNLFFVGFAIFAFTGIHFFILKEEKFMWENYGEEYEKYSKNVRRYF